MTGLAREATSEGKDEIIETLGRQILLADGTGWRGNDQRIIAKHRSGVIDVRDGLVPGESVAPGRGEFFEIRIRGDAGIALGHHRILLTGGLGGGNVVAVDKCNDLASLENVLIDGPLGFVRDPGWVKHNQHVDAAADFDGGLGVIHFREIVGKSLGLPIGHLASGGGGGEGQIAHGFPFAEAIHGVLQFFRCLAAIFRILGSLGDGESPGPFGSGGAIFVFLAGKFTLGEIQRVFGVLVGFDFVGRNRHGNHIVVLGEFLVEIGRGRTTHHRHAAGDIERGHESHGLAGVGDDAADGADQLVFHQRGIDRRDEGNHGSLVEAGGGEAEIDAFAIGHGLRVHAGLLGGVLVIAVRNGTAHFDLKIVAGVVPENFQTAAQLAQHYQPVGGAGGNIIVGRNEKFHGHGSIAQFQITEHVLGAFGKGVDLVLGEVSLDVTELRPADQEIDDNDDGGDHQNAQRAVKHRGVRTAAGGGFWRGFSIHRESAAELRKWGVRNAWSG